MPRISARFRRGAAGITETPAATLSCTLVFLLVCGPVYSGGINSDEALAPNVGGLVLRVKGSYSKLDAGPAGDADGVGLTAVVAYGLTKKSSLFFKAPLLYRNVEVNGTKSDHFGPGDFTVFYKYRFWQKDTTALDTYRWAWVGGLNVRTGDSRFSSDSYDPLAGVVMSLQRSRHHLNGDLVYQMNTGSRVHKHDSLRYDLAYSYRIFPAHFTRGKAFQWEIVGEVNGKYFTDGSNAVFLSPGLQYSAQRWLFEASVQLPVIQELASGRPETDYRLVTGFQYHF